MYNSAFGSEPVFAGSSFFFSSVGFRSTKEESTPAMLLC